MINVHVKGWLTLAAFDAAVCSRWLSWCREIEKFLPLQWWGILQKPQTAVVSVNEPLDNKIKLHLGAGVSFYNPTTSVWPDWAIFKVLGNKVVTYHRWLHSSVTRFGEISPLWQYFNSRCKFSYSLFSRHVAEFETYLGNFYYWANFRWCKYPNIESII